MAKNISLELPPWVPQKNPHTCWAAALESWLKVVPHRQKYTQAQLLGNPEWAEYLDSQGGLDLNGFGVIAGDVGIGMDWNIAMSSDQMPGSDGGPELIYEILSNSGYVWIAYRVEGGYHANVIYGIFKNFLKAVDPGPDQFKPRPWDFYTYKFPVIMGWPIM